MKRTITIIGILSVLAYLATSASAEVDGVTVIKRMLEAEKTATFTAHQVTTLARDPSLTSEQIVYREGLRGMRTEYTKPAFMDGEVMADDGRVSAHFIPKDKVMHMRPSRLSAMMERARYLIAAVAKGHVKVELVGKDKIAGRNTYVIEVKSKGHHGKAQTRKLWVDTDKWVKLKTEEIAPDGTVVSMTYFTEISFTGNIPNEKFHLRPPPGTRVEHDQVSRRPMPIAKARELARFRIVEPSYLPAGYKLIGATVLPFRDGKIASLRYTDGVSSFSLFQTPGEMLKSKFLERLHHGPARLKADVYSWRVKELNLTIVGSLRQDEMRKIAGSVK